MKATTKFPVVAVLVIALSMARAGASEVVSVSINLCSPPMPRAESGGTDRTYNTANALFVRSEFRLAARAYYQTFRCHGDPLYMGVDPKVYDHHLLAPFDFALRLAAAGKFKSAVEKLNQITTALPRFGEARYLTGVFEWASGNRHAALRSWKKTLRAPYFAQPPDAPEPILFKDTREMLRWGSARAR